MPRFFCFLTGCLATAACLFGADKIDAAAALQSRMCGVFNDRREAVVKIFAVAPAPQEGARKILSVGTAFFIDKKGRLLANANVVAGAERLWFEHDGRPFEARCLGADPLTNLALLQAEETPARFQAVDVGGGNLRPETATLLLAVTCKLGFEPAPSFGMLTGRNAAYGEQTLPTAYLRTDIPSDGAEGGSPVFDLDGRFVGLIVVSLPEIRASFLLPAAAVARVSEALARSGVVDYAYFGFEARQRIDVDGALQVCLDAVENGGPADAAGLEKGDIVLQVGERTVRTGDDLREAVFFTQPEKTVLIKVSREGKERTFALRAAARASAGAQAAVAEASRP